MRERVLMPVFSEIDTDGRVQRAAAASKALRSGLSRCAMGDLRVSVR